MIPLALLACAPELQPTAEAPARWAPAGPAAAAVVDALDAFLPVLMDMHALPAVEAYESLTTSMESTCPDRYEEPGSVHWSGRCTTTRGVTYAGAAFWIDVAIAGLPEERWGGVAELLPPEVPLRGREFFGQIDIIHPDLGDFRCSGSAAVLASDDGVTRIEVSRTEGDCAYSGAPPDSWLSGSPRPTFTLLRQWQGEELVDVRIEGSVADLEGEISALKLFVNANTDYGRDKCKVSGWVQGRDQAGAWTRLRIDVAETPGCVAAMSTVGERPFYLPFEPMAEREPWPW